MSQPRAAGRKKDDMSLKQIQEVAQKIVNDTQDLPVEMRPTKHDFAVMCAAYQKLLTALAVIARADDEQAEQEPA
jgi:hypothetical protein